MIEARDIDLAVSNLLPVMSSLLGHLRSVVDRCELNWLQIAIINGLDPREATTVAELARMQGLNPGILEGVFFKLENRGMIERRHVPDDHVVSYALTFNGYKARREIRRARYDSFIAACEELGPAELEQLILSTTLIGLAEHEWLRAALGKLTPIEQDMLVSTVDLMRRLETP